VRTPNLAQPSQKLHLLTHYGTEGREFESLLARHSHSSAWRLVQEPAGGRPRFEADAGTRTPDPFITSEVLYQLSYVGAGLMLPPPRAPPGRGSRSLSRLLS
jgi:hypothetical protein